MSNKDFPKFNCSNSKTQRKIEDPMKNGKRPSAVLPCRGQHVSSNFKEDRTHKFLVRLSLQGLRILLKLCRPGFFSQSFGNRNTVGVNAKELK